MGKKTKQKKLERWLDRLYEKPLSDRDTKYIKNCKKIRNKGHSNNPPATTTTPPATPKPKKPKPTTAVKPTPTKPADDLKIAMQKAKEKLHERERHRARVEMEARNKELDRRIARDEELAIQRRKAIQERHKKGAEWAKQAIEREQKDWENWTRSIRPSTSAQPHSTPIPPRAHKPIPSIKKIEIIPHKVILKHKCQTPTVTSPETMEEEQKLLEEMLVDIDEEAEYVGQISPEDDEWLKGLIDSAME